MKYIQTIISACILLACISCSNMKNGNDQNGGGSGEPKTYGTAAEAAAAAKNDMISALDQKVDLGVTKEQLQASAPGTPVMQYNVNWDDLLKADSSTDLEKIATSRNTSIVPFVANNEVVTIAGLNNENQKFKVSMLGNKHLSTELDMVSKAVSGMQGSNIVILEIPNLPATIYKASMPTGGSMYFTSYNNNSLRQGMSAATIIPMLRTEAEGFQRRFGDQLKKGNLAH
ncbi:hypothetical protein ACTHGU_12735 [Chitinophagaceae bacterium MMS25-I14]